LLSHIMQMGSGRLRIFDPVSWTMPPRKTLTDRALSVAWRLAPPREYFWNHCRLPKHRVVSSEEFRVRKTSIVAVHGITPLLAVVAFAFPATSLRAQTQTSASNPARKPIMAIGYPM